MATKKSSMQSKFYKQIKAKAIKWLNNHQADFPLQDLLEGKIPLKNNENIPSYVKSYISRHRNELLKKNLTPSESEELGEE